MMYQHSKQALPPCISSFFSPISSIHSRRTRSTTKKNLYIPKFSFSRCLKCIKYQGVKIWNAIPINIRDQNLNKFNINFKYSLSGNTKDNKVYHLFFKNFLLYDQRCLHTHFFLFYVLKFLLRVLLLYMLQRLFF